VHIPNDGPDESGVQYLRTLRQMEMKMSPKPATNDQNSASGPSLVTTAPAASAPESAPNERRRFTRYKCSSSAETKKLGTTVRTWVTFTDISLGGGYVELQARFPPVTEMELTLDLNVIRVHTRAVVRVTVPFLGMGLASTEMAPDERSRLEQMVGALGG